MKVQQKYWSMFDKVYGSLAGVHRVQRVSATEKNDRRHTSTVMVLVLPDDIGGDGNTLKASDVRVDTFRASGPGGQHRNKTDSGVRMTHIPSGIVVTATEDRSQHRNREVAWSRLKKSLSEVDTMNRQAHVDDYRRDFFNDGSVNFVWTSWRDEVKAKSGQKTSMRKALNGKLSPLLK